MAGQTRLRGNSKFWGLGQLLGLANFLSIATAAMVISFIAFLLQRQQILTVFNRVDARRSESFAEICEEAISKGNPAFVPMYMKLLKESYDVSYAYYADAGRTIRYHIFPSRAGSSMDDPVNLARPKEHIELAVHIPSGGWAVLGFRRADRQAVIKGFLWRASMGVVAAAAVAVAVGFLLSLLMARRVTRPIEELNRGALAIGQGRFETRVGTARVREVHELGEVFNQMAGQLEELDRMKDDVLSMVTHDLRTPLAAMVSVIDVLRDGGRGPVTEVQKEYLGIVKENAFALLAFVNDMLDMAKIKAGKVEYHFGKVDLTAAVARATELFAAYSRQKGVALHSQVPDHAWVLADSEKLDHILINLISNALKHAPSESGSVTVRAAKNPAHWQVQVIDNGPGISAENLPRIFQKFATFARNSANFSQGTGIGLVVVKTFVEGQGGQVSVESTPGAGSVFSFTLPGQATA